MARCPNCGRFIKAGEACEKCKIMHAMEEFIWNEPDTDPPKSAGIFLIFVGLSATLVVAGILAWLV